LQKKKIICKSGVMKLGANHCFDLKISRKNRKIKFLYKM